MKRILFAWEMGANFGHLARLVPLALRLRKRGDQVLFVIRDLRHARQFLMAQGLPFVCAPAPMVGRPPAPGFLPVSYADILALQGMSSIDTLEPQVAAWRTIFDLFKPDVVVLDHAPIAMLAAQLARLPRVAIGTGFELPPLTTSFPLFRMASDERRAALLQLEQRLLQTLNQLAAQHGHAPLEKNADIFRGTARCFVTLPELDHYGQRQDVDYVGLMPAWRGQGQAEPVTWPHSGTKILAYLQPSYPPANQVLQALGNSGHAVIACVPGTGPSVGNTRNMHICRRFIDTNTLLAQADLLISHGGHGMTGEALMAGKPALILPQHMEQRLLANRVEALGAGKSLPPQRAAEESIATVETLLEDRRYRGAAEKFGHRYSATDRNAALAGIISSIDAATGFLANA